MSDRGAADRRKENLRAASEEEVGGQSDGAEQEAGYEVEGGELCGKRSVVERGKEYGEMYKTRFGD